MSVSTVPVMLVVEKYFEICMGILVLGQEIRPAGARTFLVSKLLKLRVHMLVGASRAVLGTQGCEIEWTAGIGPVMFFGAYYTTIAICRPFSRPFAKAF